MQRLEKLYSSSFIQSKEVLINKSVTNTLKIQSFTMSQIVALNGSDSGRQTTSEAERLQVSERESLFQLFKGKYVLHTEANVQLSRAHECLLKMQKDLLYDY